MTSPEVHVPGGAFQRRGSQAGPLRSLADPGVRVAAAAGWDEGLMYVSMAFLLISTVPGASLITYAAKLVWLISFAVLTALNTGAAFGVYVAAVAMFRSFHFEGWGSVVERPDNYALVMLVTSLAMRMLVARSSRVWDRSMLVIVGFVGYGLLQIAGMGLFTRSTFAYYMGMLGLPMLMFLLLRGCGSNPREFRGLMRSLFVLGIYMAMVSIAEHAGWYHLILPPWVGDPSSSVRRLYARQAGGLMMQPAWNGLALSLIYCLALLYARLFGRSSRWLPRVVGLLCLVGVFLSYSRAAWLAVALTSFVLLWRPGATRMKTQVKRFGVIAASVAFVLALALLPDTTARDRLGNSETVLYRLNVWKAGLRMAAERPLLGTGFGTFASKIGDYQEEMTVGEHTNIQTAAAHNTELGMLVELGTIGFVLYAAALIVIFRRAKTAALRLWGREGAVWVAVFFGAYFLQGQLAFTNEPTTNQIFFGMMGTIAGLLVGGPGKRSAGVFPSPIPTQVQVAQR